jgi:predicted nucleic acid-binding protein
MLWGFRPVPLSHFDRIALAYEASLHARYQYLHLYRETSATAGQVSLRAFSARTAHHVGGTCGELHFGASKSSQSDRAMLMLKELIQDIPVEPLDYAAGQAYGEIRAALEKRGRLIGNNDLWIAAHAMASRVTLVTNNEREFRRIPRPSKTGSKVDASMWNARPLTSLALVHSFRSDCRSEKLRLLRHTPRSSPAGLHAATAGSRVFPLRPFPHRPKV